MAYSQYSKTANLGEDEASTSTSNSNFSTLSHLLASNTRKRAMGRVKTKALPQRMNLGSPKDPDKSLSTLPQRPQRPQIRNLSPLPSPQRPRRFVKNTPEKFPMPQRMNTAIQDLKTPEMPTLKTISPSTLRRKKRSPSPRSRSQSTPPVMKRPQAKIEPKIEQIEARIQPQIVQDSRPQMVVNGTVYYVVDRIGKGGSSDVFQVFEATNSKIRAIKRVDLSEVSESEAWAFRNEVKLLERLKGNDKIITLIDFEERQKPNGSGTELFVVMENGQRDLASLLKEISASENGLTDAKTKFYWEEMLEAVSVVHKENIVHSDLKPANFLIVDGMLKLIDFGIASSVTDNKTHVTKDNLMGTFNFMSPEAIKDLNAIKGEDGRPIVKIGFKSDVWSLGCILYNLVYKKLPFGHIRNPVMKLQAILDPEHQISFPSDPGSLRGHDPKVVEVLKSCLIRDPYERAEIKDLLGHPYLKAGKGPQQNLLAVDNLLSAISTLTPNSRKVVMDNLTNTAKIPHYTQQD